MIYNIKAILETRVEADSIEEAQTMVEEGYRISDCIINIQPITHHEDLNKEEDIEHFVETYRKLFPPGTKDGVHSFRGDKQGCMDKMRWFLKTYPQFTQQDILDATKEYVYQSRVRGKLMYMQQANYFIRKDRNSNLAGLCESKGSKEERRDRVGGI